MDRKLVKTPIDLFNRIQSKVSDPSNYGKLVLAKWQEYTIQYQERAGILGLNSYLTIWNHDHRVCKVTCKQLTVNDEKKITSIVGGGIYILKLIDAIEQDQIVSIGSIQQLWRITIGGYIASKWSKLASNDN